MRRPRKYNSETSLQIQVADYLCLQYPNVIFHSDYGSGANLNAIQAITQKRLNGGKRAWPDMFIAEPSIQYQADANDYDSYGLFIEVKKDGTRLKKKNGEWATPHIEEQAEMLEKLRDKGYKAEFAVGFDEAKKIIDQYLS